MLVLVLAEPVLGLITPPLLVLIVRLVIIAIVAAVPRPKTPAVLIMYIVRLGQPIL